MNDLGLDCPPSGFGKHSAILKKLTFSCFILLPTGFLCILESTLSLSFFLFSLPPGCVRPWTQCFSLK